MSRPGFAHLDWSKAHHGRPGPSLADSAIHPPEPAALGIAAPGGLPHPEDLLPGLERALAGRIGAPGGRVLVTAGASEANACLFAALLEPGDEVLVESPGYEPHRVAPAWFGARVRTFARCREWGYGRVAEAVEAALSPATRLVLLTDLHNPSGVALADADAEALTALAERRGLRIACDETFRDAGTRPEGTHAARSTRWVTTSTLTKAYGLGALRVGWIAGSAEVLAACAAAQNALSVEPAGPSLAWTAALLPHLPRLRARGHAVLERNRERWRACTEGLPCDAGVRSEGTTTFVHLPGVAGGDAFAEFAEAGAGLRVVPGRFFGEPRGVRVALGGEPGACAAALDVFRSAVLAFDARGTGREAP